MRSPFPGTDPYLEQYWGDIHHRLITYISDALQKELPRRFTGARGSMSGFSSSLTKG